MLICPKCRTTYSSSGLAHCYRDGERLVDHERFLAVERDPLRGALIGGKYKLVERIGQGGMGTVYRAVQSGLNRSVAVKILKRELNLDRDTVARFHREANAMSLLTHPNTVRVYDFGQTDDGLLYLVMELLEGELLTTKMLREGALDVLDAVRFAQQILRSLAEAHKKAIVHRDLKPDNVFVARVEGHGDPVVKVLDFGIAKVVAPDRRVDQFETQAGTVFGTPRYMSPEQAQGAALDGRSDLYSVGTLLYQMLTGRAPFTDDDAVVVMAKHIQEMPVAPNEAAPERPIPKALNEVVLRALAKEPSERFQEASEFDGALEGCVSEVVTAQTAALTGRWSQRPNSRRRLLAVASAAALFSMGYFGVRVYAKLRQNEGLTTVALPNGPEPSAAAQREAAPPEPQGPTAVPIAPAPEREVSPEPAPARVPIDVEIASQPSGAAVYRKGKRLGQTPLALRVRPEEDLVLVELRLAGYQPLAAELTAKDGKRMLALTPTAKPARRLRKPEPRRVRSSEEPSSASAPTVEPTPANPPSHGPYERFE
jgi:eukaryotic-like serine/threonine-protein kinase